MIVDFNNIGAQGFRIWDWDKDVGTKEWIMIGSHCGLCGARLGWKGGLEKFCPNCGAMFIGSQNQEPPVDEIDEKDEGLA